MLNIQHLYQSSQPTPDFNIYSSAVTYLDSVIEHGPSDLLFIRVDLGIKQGHQTQVHVFQMKELFDRLNANRRCKPSIFRHYVGMIWALEWTPEKSYHYHCLFIFDAKKVQNDIELANQIGYYWMNEITDGIGSFWNSNAHTHEFQQCGIGRIRHWELGKRHNLMTRVVSYIAKPDCMVRDAIQRDAATLGNVDWAYKMRTFGTSNILKPRDSNVGRPRKTVTEEFDF
jgi:hypothetical protein